MVAILEVIQLGRVLQIFHVLKVTERLFCLVHFLPTGTFHARV
jgi:hypothetical protein